MARLFSLRLAFCGLALCAATLVQAQTPTKPHLKGVSLRSGGSLRVGPNSWAYLQYDLANPTEQPAAVRLVLRPKEQRNATIYEEAITLPPNTRLQFRTPVTIGTVEAYQYELFVDRNLAQTDELLLRLPSSNERVIAFVNDDFNLSYGNFAKNEDLHAKYVVASGRGGDLPDHWASHDQPYVMVFARPNLQRMSARQVDAVLDFVSHGGTLIFADPRGALEASQHTLLRRLLPATPLALRPLERFDGALPLGGEVVRREEGLEFLDMVPRPGTLTTLRQDGNPLVQWGRYGLGWVGMCAVYPSDTRLQNTANFTPMWNHLLHFGGRQVLASARGNRPISEALDQITGIRIPPARAIHLFLIAYFVVIVLVIGFGVFSGRRIHAWIALAVIAVVSTIAIFSYAGRRAASLSSQTASVLNFVYHGTEDVTGEQIVSLFVKREALVDLAAPDTDQQLRALLPPPMPTIENDDAMAARPPQVPPADPKTVANPRKSDLIDRGNDETIREPLRLTREQGVSRLDKLQIPYQAPRFYVSLYHRAGTPLADLPEVAWTMAGPQLAKWTLPAGLQPTYGLLVTETGYHPLAIRGQTVTLDSATVAIREVSPELVALRDFLVQESMPVPLLALIEPAERDTTGTIPRDFATLGRNIHLVPVREQLVPSAAVVPFGRTIIMPERAASRMLWRDNRWQPDSSIRGSRARDYEFVAHLPPGYNALRPNQLQVRFAADNRGRNLEFAVFLKDRNAPKPTPATKSKAKPTATDDDEAPPPTEGLIPATRTANEVFYFEDLAGRDILEPTDGQFTIVVRARPLQAYNDNIQQLSFNTWVVIAFDVAAAGTLPPETTGTR